MRTELAITWRQWAGALGCAAALHGMAATLWIGGWDSSAGFGLPGTSHVRGPLRIALVGRSASEVAHQRAPARRREPPALAARERPALPRAATASPAAPTADPPALPVVAEEFAGASEAATSAPAPHASAGHGEVGEVGAEAPGTARAGSGSAAGTSAAASDYFSALHTRISTVHARSYPRQARRAGSEGVTVVALRIDREGRIEHAAVAESSGSAVLDRAALRTAERAAPFGAVPEDVGDSQLEFEIPLVYAISR